MDTGRADVRPEGLNQPSKRFEAGRPSATPNLDGRRIVVSVLVSRRRAFADDAAVKLSRWTGRSARPGLAAALRGL